MNTQRWALGGLLEYVFDPEQDKEVRCNVTREANGRRSAVWAAKTCVQVAAAALAEAGANADVMTAARKLHALTAAGDAPPSELGSIANVVFGLRHVVSPRPPARQTDR